MHKEPPSVRLERETAERQRLVDLAFSLRPPPPAGTKRVMWFGDSDTPMPVDVPETVYAQMRAISEATEASDPKRRDIWARIEAEGKIHKLLRPYIDAQYPTLQSAERSSAHSSKSWWQRILRSLRLGS